MHRENRVMQTFMANAPEQIEVVAVITYDDGQIMDWAAYIGITVKDSPTANTEDIAKNGAKLYKREAVALCLGLPPEKYRR